MFLFFLFPLYVCLLQKRRERGRIDVRGIRLVEPAILHGEGGDHSAPNVSDGKQLKRTNDANCINFSIKITFLLFIVRRVIPSKLDTQSIIASPPTAALYRHLHFISSHPPTRSAASGFVRYEKVREREKEITINFPSIKMQIQFPTRQQSPRIIPPSHFDIIRDYTRFDGPAVRTLVERRWVVSSQ